MAATRALIRRGVRNLHLVALPTSSLQADLLIGAGCVAVLLGPPASPEEYSREFIRFAPHLSFNDGVSLFRSLEGLRIDGVRPSS